VAYRSVVKGFTTTDFLDQELKGRRSAVGLMRHDGDVSGVAELTNGGRAPSAPGGCPGA
jgi:hypothetical protein